MRNALCKEECELIDAFENKGNTVFAGDTEGTFAALTPIGFRKWSQPHKEFAASEFNGNTELEGDCYYIITLTTNNTNGNNIAAQNLKINLDFKKAKFVNTEIEIDL